MAYLAGTSSITCSIIVMSDKICIGSVTFLIESAAAMFWPKINMLIMLMHVPDVYSGSLTRSHELPLLVD